MNDRQRLRMYDFMKSEQQHKEFIINEVAKKI